MYTTANCPSLNWKDFNECCSQRALSTVITNHHQPQYSTMTISTDLSQQFQQQIQNAVAQHRALKITGGNSKGFYGNVVNAETLDVTGHQGILNYEPTELVITARAGTKLSEIEQLLDENGQMLAFEPPSYATGIDDTATLGGTIACNLSGPRRAYAGAARDFVLGCKIINGKGEILSFGGEVMKNVAGYDVARLMAGAMGTLGLLLEVSLKVLPKAESEHTLRFQCDVNEALAKMHSLARTALPVTATSFHDSRLHIRLSGTAGSVAAACETIGGEQLENAGEYWQQLKQQQLDFFNTDKALWRLSLASDSKPILFTGAQPENETFYEWGGALRWLKTDLAAETIRDSLSALDGHATLFRQPDRSQPDQSIESIFQPLPAAMAAIHKNLKQAFDPENILNPGKLYPDL